VKNRKVCLILLALACLMYSGCGRPTPEKRQPAQLRPVLAAGFNVAWTNPQIPSLMQPGKEHKIEVTIQNTGTDTWSSTAKGRAPVNISYHWFPAKGDSPVIFDGHRTPFPHELAPGGRITVNNVLVVAPPVPGSYRLQVSLVQEGVAWFENKGASTLTVPVSVR
jgi:hypothetical protein